MLKLGKDLGMVVIKCDNREGTESIKTIHHKINDYFYKYAYRYIDPKLAGQLYDKLVALGKELNDLKVPDKAMAKKNEILTKLRPVCKGLGELRKTSLTSEDVPLMQKAINGFLHNFITEKQKGEMPTDVVLDFLGEAKRLYDTFWAFSEDLKTDTLVNAHSQLFNMIEKRYAINLM